MAGSPLRLALCAVVGLFAGPILGQLLVPDPTGAAAYALSVVAIVLVTGGLYRSGWLRERGAPTRSSEG